MWRKTGLISGLLVLATACGDSGGEGGSPLDTVDFPDRIDFRRVPVGLRVVDGIQLVQQGTGSVQLVEARPGPDFEGTSYTLEVVTALPLDISIGSSVRFELAFEAPTDVGRIESSIDFVFSTGEERTIEVVVETAEALTVELPGNVLDLGRVVTGRVIDAVIPLRNQLERPIPIFVENDGSRPVVNQLSGDGDFEIDASVNPDGSLADSPVFGGDTLNVPIQYTPPSDGGPRDQAVWRVGACPSLLNECGIDVTIIARPVTAPIECRLEGETGLAEEIDFGRLNPPEVGTATVSCTVTGAARLDSFSTPGFQSGVSVTENFQPMVPEDVDVGTEFDVFFRFDPSRLDVGDDIPEETTFEINVTDPELGVELPSSVITLKGGHGRPIISLSPSTLDFQSARVGTERPDRFTVTNTGIVPFLGRMRIENGPDTEDGAFNSPTAGTQFVVDPGVSRIIDVTFVAQPPTGAKSATIFIETTEFTDPRNPNIQASLVATGVSEALPPCNSDVNPSTEVVFGQSKRRTENRAYIVIKNDDSSRCLLNGIRFAPGSDPAFQLVDPPAELRLGRNETYPIEVAFTPDRPDDAASFDFTGTLEFYLSDDTGYYQIPVSGRQAQVSMIRAPNVVDFVGGENSCTQYIQEVALINGSDDSVSVQSISVESSDFTTFDLQFDQPPPFTINRLGGRRAFRVVGRPPASGTEHRTARVEVDIAGEPTPFVIPILLQAGPDLPVSERFVQAGAPETEVLWVLPHHGDGAGESVADLTNRASTLWDQFIAPVTAAGVRHEVGFIRAEDTNCGTRIAPGPDEGTLHRGGCGWLANGDIPPNSGLFTDLWKLIDGQDGMLTQASAFQGHVNKPINTFIQLDPALDAAFLSMHPTIIGGWNEELQSPDAHIHFVFLNNNDDASARELQNYVDWLRYVRGYPRRFDQTSSAIVGPEGGCETGELGSVRDGARFRELNRLLGGGLAKSACTNDWAATMDEVGREASGVRRRVQLTRAPQVDSLQVFADGVEVPAGTEPEPNWTFDPIDRLLTFTSSTSAAVAAGAEVEIRYDPLCSG